MAAKLHHTVPQLLLTRFTAANGEVRVVQRDDFSKWFETGPAGVLAENHFYTIETPDGPDTGVEEDLFAKKVEGPAARALRRVVDEGIPLMPGLRTALSIFFAFQFLRGAAHRAALLEHYDALGKSVAALATVPMVKRYVKADDGGELPDEEAEELVRLLHRTDDYRIGLTNEANYHLRSVLPIALDLVPYIENRCWHLMTFPGPLLITSDEPIGLVSDSLDPVPGDRTCGVGTASEIVVPVDPMHAFLLDRGDHSPQEFELAGTPDMARIINNHVGYACHRWIVHRPGTDPLRGLTFAAKGSRIRVQGAYVAFSPRPPRRRSRARR